MEDSVIHQIDTIQFEIDNLFSLVNRKIEHVSRRNDNASVFLDYISRKQYVYEMQKRKEIVTTKPHHNNYEPKKKEKVDVSIAEPPKPNRATFHPPNDTGSTTSRQNENLSKPNFTQQRRKRRAKEATRERKKKLPLYVSKHTVQRKVEKKQKKNDNLQKLDQVLRLARKTRKMINKKKSKSVAKPFHQAKKTSKILKSNVPINRKKLKKDLETIEDPIFPENSQPKVEHRIEEKEPVVEEEEEVERKEPERIVRKAASTWVEKRIKNIQNLQKKHNISRIKYESVSERFLELNHPIRTPSNINTVDLSFLFGVFEFLRIINEILFQSSDSSEQSLDEKEEEPSEKDTLQIKKVFNKLKREIDFIQLLGLEDGKDERISDYEKKCRQIMFPTATNSDDERHDDETSNETNIWLPLRIYQNIDELLYPKFLLKNDFSANSFFSSSSYHLLMSFRNRNEIKSLYSVRNRVQVCLLYHYIEKIVSKNMLTSFFKKSKREGAENQQKGDLILWRFLHSVLTQKGKYECTFVKKHQE